MALWLIGFIFLFRVGQRSKLCIRGHASKNKPDRLPLHIHVSQSRFIASWHNVRTINVSYVARLSHYRDSLTCCSFKYKMYTAAANKTFWVCGCPLQRDDGVCSQSPGLITGGSQTPGAGKPPPFPLYTHPVRENVKHKTQYLSKISTISITAEANRILIVCVPYSSWHFSLHAAISFVFRSLPVSV